ncbi:MAG: hypothetical protein AABW84_01315 [Nanoarchaeota archaeon]
MKHQFNTTTTAVVIAVAILAIAFVTAQTGFAVTPQTQVDYCLDSDVGLDATHTTGACEDTNGVHTDMCVGENTVQETGCLTGSKICAYDIVQCPIGETCSSGRCVATA